MTLTNIGQGTVTPTTVTSPTLTTAYQAAVNQAAVSLEVCASVTIAGVVANAEEVQLQVSATQTGSTGWAVKDRCALSGIVASDGHMLRAIVPAGCWYRVTQTSGTTGVTLNSIQTYRI